MRPRYKNRLTALPLKNAAAEDRNEDGVDEPVCLIEETKVNDILTIGAGEEFPMMIPSKVEEVACRPLQDSRLSSETYYWTEAEESALTYLSTEIHHPVISCFREISGNDIVHLFSGKKLQQAFNNLESVLLCLGIIDYLATCVDNPLYNENGKFSEKTIPKFVEKIIKAVKGTLRKWGMNGENSIKQRLDTVFSFLRRLTPFFKPINYDQTYSQLVNELETDTCLRRPLRNSKNIMELTGSSSGYQGSVQLDVLCYNKQDFGPNKHHLQETMSNAKDSSPITVLTDDASDRNPNEILSIQTGIRRTAATKRPPSDDKLALEPVTKKEKLFPGMVSSSFIATPPKNAFEFLMNRSRELAQQRRKNVVH